MRFTKIILLLILFVFISKTISYAQEIPQEVIETPKLKSTDTIPISLTELRFREQYEKNIQKTRINEIYIPKDLNDAFKELSELSTSESLAKFSKADPDFVVKRLHYGLGRWIIVNWNLYDGSRIGEHIKSYGISHPDDQTRFILLTFHNFLNQKDLNISQIAARIQAERAAELLARKPKN